MYLPIKKGGAMNGIRTDHTKLSGATVNRNKWESILGRFDSLADEISRALGRSTRIEEPKSDIRNIQSQKMIEHGKIRTHFLPSEAKESGRERLSVVSRI
jgi:hypothetical protein